MAGSSPARTIDMKGVSASKHLPLLLESTITTLSQGGSPMLELSGIKSSQEDLLAIAGAARDAGLERRRHQHRAAEQGRAILVALARSAGPFRFNLSRSGLGVSMGVKGFRIGSGPPPRLGHASPGASTPRPDNTVDPAAMKTRWKRRGRTGRRLH